MGNHYEGYSNDEWEEMNEQAEIEAVEAEAKEARLDGMEKYLRRQLEELGFTPLSAGSIIYLFRNFSFDQEDRQFADPKKEVAVNDLWIRWIAGTKFYTAFGGQI